MADQSKSEILTNLKELQNRLNTNTRARNTFLADPAGTLARQGVELSAARAKALKSFIDKQTSVAKGQVVGASVRAGTLKNDVEVVVTVGVHF